MSRDANGKWLPGTSPNPGGRPKGRGLKQEIERKLKERLEGSRMTRSERIADVLVGMAEQGDLRAAELILKRVWPERLALEGERDSLTTVIVRNYTGIEWEEKAKKLALVRGPVLDVGPSRCAPVEAEVVQDPGPEPPNPEPEMPTISRRKEQRRRQAVL